MHNFGERGVAEGVASMLEKLTEKTVPFCERFTVTLD